MSPTDQQDFDDFDALAQDETVETDNLDSFDDEVASDGEASRKKRQTVFYMVLVLMLAMAGGIVWFVFLRAPAVQPTAQIAQAATPASPDMSSPPAANNETASAPAAQNGATGLPPGVMTPQEMANAANPNGKPQEPEKNTASLDETNQIPTIPAPDSASIAQPNTTVPVNGTVAEALPPPVAQQDMPAMTSSEQQATTTQTIAAALPNGVNATMPVETSAAGTTLQAQTSTLQPTTPTAGTQEAVAPVASTEQNSSVNDQRMLQLEQQVQALTAELNNAKAGMSAQNTSTGSNDGALAEQLKSVSEKLDRVVQQVGDLDQRTTSFASELQNRADQPAQAVNSDNTSEQPKKASVKSKVKAAKTEKPKKASTKTLKWELRSAQPGVAWLGQLGSEEMARYSVGQSVPGLGTIQEITQEGNRWIVKTTAGTLRQ